MALSQITAYSHSLTMQSEWGCECENMWLCMIE